MVGEGGCGGVRVDLRWGVGEGGVSGEAAGAETRCALGVQGDERVWGLGVKLFGEDGWTGAVHQKTKGEMGGLTGRRVQNRAAGAFCRSARQSRLWSSGEKPR